MKYIIILLSKFINKKIRKFWLKLITNFKKRRIYQEEKHKKNSNVTFCTEESQEESKYGADDSDTVTP